MKKYTQDQKIEALQFFEDGFSAREIFEVLSIPIGTLHRWKSERSDPKSGQSSKIIEASKIWVEREIFEDLVARVEKLEKKLRRANEDYDDKSKLAPSLIFKSR